MDMYLCLGSFVPLYALCMRPSVPHFINLIVSQTLTFPSFCLSLCVSGYVCLSLCKYLCQSVCLYIWVCPSLCLSVCISVNVHIYTLSACLRPDVVYFALCISSFPIPRNP